MAVIGVEQPQDRRWMKAALALSERGRARTSTNPNVGCVLVRDGRVIARGWTQPGGRPHAEAMALASTEGALKGVTAYVTLEPCAHRSERGPACVDLLVDARPARVVAAVADPDTRTAGRGFAKLRDAGIEVVEGVCREEAELVMAGFFTRQRLGRPCVTLKLATSLDGRIALASGESQWITGSEARAHTHLERARADAILVGRGTFAADRPRLDVRLPGLERRSPRRIMLSGSLPPDSHAQEDWDGWTVIPHPAAIAGLPGVSYLMVEGGAGTASAFLKADLVDRLVLYRAPILIGDGLPAVGDIGLAGLAPTHGRWRLVDERRMGIDGFEEYRRMRDA